MRILIIGQSDAYVELIRETPTGSRCQIECQNYQQALDRSRVPTLVFVEASVENSMGLSVARTILQRFPGTTLVFLMDQCRFEDSMQAMRMGAHNILVGEEINTVSIEQLLQRHSAREHTSDWENTARNFERMIFLHNESAERLWSTQALNRTFGMQTGQNQFFVLMVTGLDFVYDQFRSEPVMKKVRSEKIKQRLLRLRDSQLMIPFTFYIDQFFYLVVVCPKNSLPSAPQEQIRQIQKRIFDVCQEELGENQILLCSRSRADFSFFKECLSELDMLMEVMHCSSLPGMLSVYNMPRTRRDMDDVTTLLESATKAVAAMEEGGDFAPQFRELFSSAIMERLTFDQFMKVKEHIAFALISVYRKYGNGMEDRECLDMEFDRLQLICTYTRALEWILHICGRLVGCCGKRYHPLVAQCIHLIAQRYPTQISQQEIANELNISNVYLSTLFRRETGVKFSTYVNAYRLNKAKEWMDRGDYPLSRIYEMVGFTNQQYFSNCFRKKFGMTPSEYKRKTRKMSEKIVNYH